MKKTAGAAADPLVDTEYVIPAARVTPWNIQGNAYPGIINASSYPSVVYIGKKRPGVSISFFAKPGLLTADLINAWIFNLSGTPIATDRFSIKLFNTIQSRVWDWCRCTGVTITGGASGGPVVVQANFVSRWGETECPYGSTLPDGEIVAAAPVFAVPTPANQAGQLAGVVDYDFRSDGALGTASGGTWTAKSVRGFVLHLMRAQGLVDYIDGTPYAKEVATGMFSGALSIDQNPTTDTIPSTSATLRLFTNAGADQGIKIAALLKKDSTDQPMEMGIETLTSNYTLYSPTGGNPATCTKYSPA